EIVDEIAVCLPPNSEAYIEPIARICEEEGRVVRIPVPPSGLVVPGGREETIDGTVITSLAYGPDRAIALVFKRLFDIALSSLVLIVFSPVMAAISVAIWFGSGGPVLFRQVRVGLRGRPFRVIKFRTMGVDAESRLEELRAQNELAGPAFKMSNDPRISH